MGIMPSYASYNPRDQDVVQDAVLICLANSFFSMVAGLAVFSIMGYMAGAQHTCVTEVAQGGPGLAFVVFPTALSMMPGAAIWSLLFFAMLLALGIDSAFSMVESFNTALADFVAIRQLHATCAGNSGAAFEVEGRRDLATVKQATQQVMQTRVTPIVCVVGWLLGIVFCTQSGLYWLDVFNKYVIFTLTLVGCVECVAATWVRDALAAASEPTLAVEISAMIGRELHPAWDVMWRYVCPVGLGALWLSAMVSELASLFDGGARWAGWSEPPSAGVVIFGWSLGLLPSVVGSAYFLWGKGAQAQPGALF